MLIFFLFFLLSSFLLFQNFRRPSQSLIDQHLDVLKSRDAEKEKIARLREQQVLDDNDKQTAQGKQELYKMLKRKFGTKGRGRTDL